MENLEKIRREIKNKIDNLIQKQQLKYIEACMQFARDTYFLVEQSLYEIVATCFVDYYVELVYKRENNLYQQELIPQQDNHDYNRFKKLEKITDVFKLWKADPDCFIRAIDTCYQSQKETSNQSQQYVNTYDQMYLERIVGSIPNEMGYQKRKDAQHG